MARMPGAVWKPLPNPSKTKMDRYDLYVVHTMVGSLAGTDGYFQGLTNGVNSHFGIGGYGENWQWVDTAVRSGANGAGNHRAITAENADMGPGFAAWNTKDGSAVPPLTPEQIETNAQNLAWAHREHGVPLQLAPNSLPGSRGLAYHRQGIDPWRVPGGEVWSSSNGKVCPADRRVKQIPLILARAQQIVNGDDDMTPAETEMLNAARSDANNAAKIASEVRNWITDPNHGVLKQLSTIAAAVAASRDDVDEQALAAALAPSLVPAVMAAVQDKGGLSKDDVEQAVRDVLRSLQSTLPEGDAADPR